MDLVLQEDNHYGDIETYNSSSDIILHHVLFNTKQIVIGTYSAFRPAIFVVIITKIIHLLIQILFGRQEKLVAIITCFAGSYQLYNFLLELDQNHDTAKLLATIIIIHISYIFVSSSLRRPKKTSSISPVLVVDVMFMLGPILHNEYQIKVWKREHLMATRPIIMTLSMKFLSITSRIQRYSDILKTSAYLLHPASCLFGPWHSYESTSKLILDKRLVFGQLLSFTKNMIISFVALIVGDTLPYLILLILDHSGWSHLVGDAINIYMEAFEFRLSHYFTCFLAISFLSLWSDPRDEQMICGVMSVEWPRSLVQVVVNWNVPMHRWLKEFIFNPVRTRSTNSLIPILVTYLVSSLLHGFKFHIWSVLLTLGIATWIEYRLRKRLSHFLDACILPRSCQLNEGKCIYGHRRTGRNPLIWSVNLFFRLLAMTHLAYLGCIFSGLHDQATYMKVLHNWSNMYFYSHIILVLEFVLTLLPTYN